MAQAAEVGIGIGGRGAHVPLYSPGLEGTLPLMSYLCNAHNSKDAAGLQNLPWNVKLDC